MPLIYSFIVNMPFHFEHINRTHLPLVSSAIPLFPNSFTGHLNLASPCCLHSLKHCCDVMPLIWESKRGIAHLVCDFAYIYIGFLTFAFHRYFIINYSFIIVFNHITKKCIHILISLFNKHENRRNCMEYIEDAT